jgi:prepilin-type N-terminal cleavage/methylation domain-containing protein
VRGFSLIELLISIVVIGVLLSLIAPNIASIRKKAFDLLSQNLARNLALQQEIFFSENQRYFSCNNSGCAQYLPHNRLPANIEVDVQSSGDEYIIKTKHQYGQKEWIFDSSIGGFR